ncbi:MAG: hypothetical protein KVP17_000841 [Porospora cf. gigantea B]|nr:MAG: hypothetical protein KVP17_000841 [Porospora cf. gigantea B]
MLRRAVDASLKSLLDCLCHLGARRYPRSYVGAAFPYARTVRFVLALFFIPPLVPYCILLHLLSLLPKGAKLLHHKLCPPIRPLSCRSVPGIVEVVELWIQDVVLETNCQLGFL